MNVPLIVTLLLVLAGCTSDNVAIRDASADVQPRDAQTRDSRAEGGTKPLEGGADAADSQPGPPDAGKDAPTPVDQAAPSCRVTVCLAGALTRDDGGNPELAKLCAQLPGIVEDCGAKCYPMFDMFGTDKALAALIKALDGNADGAVDDKDPTCDIAIVGYSWGGVNATVLAERLVGDPRVAPARKIVHKLIAIDPFAPGANVKAVKGVKVFWEYRHSKSPSGDCSAGAPLGPYKGLAPSCHPSVRCVDYD